MTEYTYLIGTLILLSAWMVFFFVNTTNQREMLVSSLYGLLFGFTESWFIPDYWSPPLSVFGLIERLGFGIESLIVGFTVGGIAPMVLITITRSKQLLRFVHRAYLPMTAALFLYVLSEGIFPGTTIYNMTLIFILVSFHSFLDRRLDYGLSVLNGFCLGIMYIALFHIFHALFPNYIVAAYISDYVATFPSGLPIEEFFFALSVGVFWHSLFRFFPDYNQSS